MKLGMLASFQMRNVRGEGTGLKPTSVSPQIFYAVLPRTYNGSIALSKFLFLHTTRNPQFSGVGEHKQVR